MVVHDPLPQAFELSPLFFGFRPRPSWIAMADDDFDIDSPSHWHDMYSSGFGSARPPPRGNPPARPFEELDPAHAAPAGTRREIPIAGAATAPAAAAAPSRAAAPARSPSRPVRPASRFNATTYSSSYLPPPAPYSATRRATAPATVPRSRPGVRLRYLDAEDDDWGRYFGGFPGYSPRAPYATAPRDYPDFKTRRDMWESLSNYDRWPFASLFQWTPSPAPAPPSPSAVPAPWLEGADEDAYEADLREALRQSQETEAARVRKEAAEREAYLARQRDEEERHRRRLEEERRRMVDTDELIARQLQADEDALSGVEAPGRPLTDREVYPSASSWADESGLAAAETAVAARHTPRETLFAALTAAGYAHRDVGAGGDCLFLSLSDQTFGTPAHHLSLRNLIVDEIEGNRDFYDEDVRAMTGRWDAGAFPAYCEKMRREGECGDAVCIAAFARVFESDVVVLFYDEKKGALGRVVFEHSPEDEDPAGAKRPPRAIRHIAWYRSISGDETMNHYVSVYPGKLGKR